MKGSTATIDTEKGTIRIKYDSASGITSGSNQIWAKIGSESEISFKNGSFYETPEKTEEEDSQENEDTENDNAEDENYESIMSEYSISNSNVEDTTKTASTEQSNTEE